MSGAPEQGEDDPKRRLMLATMAFLEQGHTPTTRELASRAEVNIAAINYYFQGKDNLIAQALDEAATRDLEVWFSAALDPSVSTRDRLIEATHFLARVHHNYSKIARQQLSLIAFKDLPERATTYAIKRLSELVAARLFLPPETPVCMLKASTLMASLHYLSIFHHQYESMTGQDVSSPEALKVHVLRLLETLGL